MQAGNREAIKMRKRCGVRSGEEEGLREGFLW